MPETIRITRYPNRRLYDHRAKKYVNLDEIEALILHGENVCIRDKKTDEDLTRLYLMQILLERHPERTKLLPTSFLHEMLRADQLAFDWLTAYFGQALESMKQMGAAPAANWMPGWDFWQSLMPQPAERSASAEARGDEEPPDDSESRSDAERADELAARVADLERRLKDIEAK